MVWISAHRMKEIVTPGVQMIAGADLRVHATFREKALSKNVVPKYNVNLKSILFVNYTC